MMMMFEPCLNDWNDLVESLKQYYMRVCNLKAMETRMMMMMMMMFERIGMIL